MENNTEKYNIYYENLKGIFEKIKKNLSKKNSHYNELITFFKEYPEKLNSDKGKELNADKYFYYIKIGLEMIDNFKLIEQILEHLQKLIKDDLLLGLSDDLKLTTTTNNNNHNTTLNMNTSSNHSVNETSQSERRNLFYKRKMIDTIIDTVIKLFNINDENIWLNAVKLLYSLYKNPRIKIHNESLLKIFRICIRIYLSSRTSINVDTTKSSLNNMILHLFQKMESANSCFNINNYLGKHSDLIDDRDSNFNTNLSINGKSTGNNKNSINSGSDIGSNLGFKMYVNQTYKNPLESMIGKMLKTAVDDITLHLAKENESEGGKYIIY
jgi:hypothetical protein